MKKLHPGARWLFRFRSYPLVFFFMIFFGVFFNIFVSALFILLFSFSELIVSVFLVLFYLFLIIFVSEVYARMTYNRFLYDVGEDYIKIERGIIWKKYTSIPYERVQNVDIKRGIVARIFGFSSLDVETAGNSGINYRNSRNRRMYQSEGHIPALAIDEAEKIRKFVIKKIKENSDSGL